MQGFTLVHERIKCLWMLSVKVLNKFISPTGQDYSYMAILLSLDKIY